MADPRTNPDDLAPDQSGRVTLDHGDAEGFSGEGGAGSTFSSPAYVDAQAGAPIGGTRDEAGNPQAGAFNGAGGVTTKPPGADDSGNSFAFNEGTFALPADAGAVLTEQGNGASDVAGTAIVLVYYTANADGDETVEIPPFWQGSTGVIGGDRSTLDENAAAVAGVNDPTTLVHIGSVSLGTNSAEVYTTAPGVGLNVSTGLADPNAPDNTTLDGAQRGFTDSWSGGSATVILANAPEPVQILAGSALVLPGPAYPTYAAIYVGYVTSSDDPSVPLGWNELAEYDSNQDGALTTAADFYTAFQDWAPAALQPYSGLVGTTPHTNGDDSTTTVYVFTSLPGIGVHAAADSNADTPEGAAPTQFDPASLDFPTLTAVDGNWQTDNVTTYLTPTIVVLDDTGEVTLPNALKEAIDEIITLCGEDTDLLSYTGVAIPYLTTDGGDGDPQTYVISDFGLTDAWAPDLTGLITAGYGLTTDDPSDNDAQQMAVDMGLDPAVWGYIGKVQFSIGHTVFIYTTIPGYFAAADPDTGAITRDEDPPADADTGTWEYTTLTGGGGEPTLQFHPGSSASGHFDLPFATVHPPDFQHHTFHVNVIDASGADATTSLQSGYGDGTNSLEIKNILGSNQSVSMLLNPNGDPPPTPVSGVLTFTILAADSTPGVTDVDWNATVQFIFHAGS